MFEVKTWQIMARNQLPCSARCVQFASDIYMSTSLTCSPYILNITSVSFCGLTGQSKVGHTRSKNRLGEKDQSDAIMKTEIRSKRKITG